MDIVSSNRQLFRDSHCVTEATIDGVDSQQLHWQPTGTAHPLGATYAHIVLGEDMWFKHTVSGQPPLCATTWTGRTGLSAMPPSPAEGTGDWGVWARSVRVDLPAFREYAKAVYEATDAWLAEQKPEDMDRIIDSGFAGPQTVGWLCNMAAIHGSNHTGELSAIKGTQGLRGYPF